MKTNSTRKTLLLSVLAAIFTLSLTVMAVMGFANTSAFKANAEATVGISNVNVTLNEDIVVKFHTDATAGDGTKVVVSFNDKTTEITENANGVFSFAGVTPQNLNDEMTVTMYAADGETQIGETKTFSVQSYLETCLALDYAASGCASEVQYTAMKELAVDLLNYGAAAQTYVNHDTENLANKNLTPEQQALATETITNVESDKAVEGDMWVGAGVRFDYKLGLFFVFKADSLDGITASFDGVEVTPEEYEVNGTTDKCWVIRYNAFNAVNMNDAVTATLTVGEDTQTFTYSIASYVVAMRGEEDALANLVNATYAYGYAAVAYSAQYETVTAPTLTADGSIQMTEDSKMGYDFTDTAYASVTLPALNVTDYATASTKSGGDADPDVTTTYTFNAYPAFTYSVVTDDTLRINNVYYSRYEMEKLNTDNVTATYDATAGYTYHAETQEDLTLIAPYGHDLTITGTVNVTSTARTSINNHLYIGTAETPANVTITCSATNEGLVLWSGADLTVAKGSSLEITANSASNSLRADAAGSYITVHGTLTTSGIIRVTGAASANTAYEYGFNPYVYIGGTLNVKAGQLITNSLQVGSEKDNVSATLNITQTKKGSTGENTINYNSSSQEIRYTFAKGTVNLKNTSSDSLSSIDARTSKSSYVDIREGITFNTTGTYGAFVGEWTAGTYYWSINSAAKLNISNTNFFRMSQKTVYVTYYTTTTMEIAGVATPVYVAKQSKITSNSNVAITVLTIANADGSKSIAPVVETTADLAPSETVATINCGGLGTFSSTTTSGVYYQVIE